jgi:hypothetical protein
VIVAYAVLQVRFHDCVSVCGYNNGGIVAIGLVMDQAKGSLKVIAGQSVPCTSSGANDSHQLTPCRATSPATPTWTRHQPGGCSSS